MKENIMWHKLVIIFILLGTLLFGCAGPDYYVDVDSISSPDVPTGKRYAMLSGKNDAPPDDLQFKEFASYVHRALREQGFTKVEKLKDADIAIFLAYGIGDPQKQNYSYSLPLYGQTGYSSSTTYGTLSTYGNTGSYSETTHYTPQYGIIGYKNYTGSYYEYFRWLMLDAYDVAAYKTSQKLMQAWQTSATSVGSSGDLRLVFPIMVAASRPFIGTNTGKKVRIVLHEKDSSVLQIKGEASQKE